MKFLTPVAFLAGVWGILIERNLFTLKRLRLKVLPQGEKPVRVLHLSDLHLAPWQKRKMRWVRSLASLKPDLVILTGDLLGHAEAQDALEHTLSPFKGIPGVFVYGSNDYYGPILKNPLKYLKSPSRKSTRIPDLNTPKLTKFLESLGFLDLNNSAKISEINNLDVQFFGLGDPHIRYHDAQMLKQSMQDLKHTKTSKLKIALVHAPYTEALDEILEYEPDVIFSGHTHGGQVRIPFYGALTSNSDLPTAKARGLSVWFSDDRASFLHVSAGLGTSIYAPVRFACRPEATLLEFY